MKSTPDGKRGLQHQGPLINMNVDDAGVMMRRKNGSPEELIRGSASDLPMRDLERSLRSNGG